MFIRNIPLVNTVENKVTNKQACDPERKGHCFLKPLLIDSGGSHLKICQKEKK